MLNLEVIYERDMITPIVPFHTPNNLEFAPTGMRDSSKCIGWLLARKGFRINQDLLGIDRPASVSMLMGMSWCWREA
ncbi:hypothetical protein BDV59DRAFT_11883 [Aspergillus ambiguus]|uniref:uncharacterized protein n=1 Tax=Aspergillus ambiguus TaxID=176160 RepID=UPI003CCE2604